ncbi:MAG: hypothetical protein A2521_03560 [Deltaproteobacteria bacterium RIFOXYD12_FULL_57_12]|nr:MAG: hypothetical protein A2521_03560 [Deltaproteobacteria bacterium RIFOXYD12_FULL_57_12]
MSIISFRGCDFFAGKYNKIEAALLMGEDRYDWNNHTVVSKFVKSGATCFDIGANIGVYTVVMANIVGPDGAVHSFEPVTHIRQKLQANLKINNQKCVRINDFALGEQESVMEMLQVKQGQYRGGTSTFIPNETISKMGIDKFEKVPVQLTTLDIYVKKNNITEINFIKIDVEGFEWNVLDGGKEIIRKSGPTILMEYDPVRHEGDSEKFRNFFNQEGYSVFEFAAFGDELVISPFRFKGCPTGRNILCIKY